MSIVIKSGKEGLKLNFSDEGLDSEAPYVKDICEVG